VIADKDPTAYCRRGLIAF